MALIFYLRTALLVDSVLQVQVHDMTVNFDAKAQEVETMVQGLAGFTPGSAFLEIEAKWSLPVSGAEFDVIGACKRLSIHSLQVPYGDKTIISQGVWRSGSLTGAVNASTELSAKFTGTYDPPS